MSNSTSSNSGTVNPRLISFKTLRQLVGCLGVGLPIVTGLYSLIRCCLIETSISAYYHTPMRNIFVGILCAVGVFMITYKGYERNDTIATRLAGLFAFCVAMFPANDKSLCNGLCQQWCDPMYTDDATLRSIVGGVHYTAAIFLFLTFAYISIALFTKTDPTLTMTLKKQQRNRLYKICGWVIVACIALLALHTLIDHITGNDYLSGIKPVFLLEAISLFAFGTSWLTKGEVITFLND